MIGDVADDPKGKPALHVHIVLGTRDGSAAPRSYCPWHPRVPIYRATHQVAALHEAIEGYADIQFANIAPAPHRHLLAASKAPGRLASEPTTLPPVVFANIMPISYTDFASSEAGSGRLSLRL